MVDSDVITSDDIIGLVFIDLNPLLTSASWGDGAPNTLGSSATGSQINGWLPVVDTILGIRGEINVQVRLVFFGDANPYRDSSAGVQFFCSSSLSPFSASEDVSSDEDQSLIRGSGGNCYRIVQVLGFVELLDWNDDPEYHWTDTFRTPRFSNESRELLLFRLSGHIRRQLGKKVAAMGGNAVIGFRQDLDLEKDERIITYRAKGTAVLLAAALPPEPLDAADRSAPSRTWDNLADSPGTRAISEFTDLSGTKPSAEPSSPTMTQNRMRDIGLEETGVDEAPPETVTAPQTPGPAAAGAPKRPPFGSKPINFSTDQRLFPIFQFPSGTVTSLGGLVTARSVKMIEADDDEDEVRDSWWQELREEVESHAKSLGCQFVGGYTETMTIDDDLYILTASGTAVNLDLSKLSPSGLSGYQAETSTSDMPNIFGREPACSICHVAYDRRRATPFPMNFTKCGRCGRHSVPEMILATMEPPKELETLTDAVLIEAHVCRPKKRAEREANAELISDALPFVQYDIHRQLIYKLKIYVLNACFGLKIRLSVGDSLIVATAVGTAMFLKALPLPAPLKITRNLGVVDEEDRKLFEIQSKIVQLSEDNRLRIESALHKALAEDITTSSSGNADVLAAILRDDKGMNDESDSDSDRNAGQRRQRRPSGEEENDRDTVPVVQSSVIVQIDDETDEDLVRPGNMNGVQRRN